MKRLLMLAFLCMSVAFTYAQQDNKQYKVYKVKGAVKVKNGKKTDDVKPNMNLTNTNTLQFADNAEIVIIDLQSNTQYTYKNKETASIAIERIVDNPATETKGLTKGFVKYLVTRLTSQDTGYADDVTASLEREMNDSVFSIPATNDSIVSKADSIISKTDSIVSVPDTVPTTVVTDSIK